MKKLPIGIDDFKRIIKDDYYYIDKTKFIESVIDDGAVVKLFTRPRRFGKTLNMSMLKYFFDISECEENKKLFKDLYVENSSVFIEQGKYPVIFITMKGIKGNSWEECLKRLKEMVKDLYSEFLFIREKLNIIEQRDFDKIVFIEDSGNFEGSLKYLTSFLKKYYDKDVILLIDEYDAPLISAYEYGYYEEALTFFKNFYGDVLKTNSNLKMGVLTGIVRIAKAGIFSDLNNLEVHTILDKEYDECFGLLELEVEKALKDYNIEHKVVEAKDWYDGYRFGDIDIYNPWSILNYLKYKELETYWIDTSGNYLIKDILKLADEETFEKLNMLLMGKNIVEEITGKATLQEVLEAEDLWELLLFSGYLTICKKIARNIYEVRIPNKEVKEFFADSFIELSFGTNLTFRNLAKNLLNNKIDKFEKSLQDILLKYMSFYDISNIEKVYHCFILGLMIHLEGKYIIISNGEGGLGRYDIAIKPLNKHLRGYILEFKVAKNEETLESKASEAVEQIKTKKYYLEFEKSGIKNISFIGLAFYKKLVKIKSFEYEKK